MVNPSGHIFSDDNSRVLKSGGLVAVVLGEDLGNYHIKVP